MLFECDEEMNCGRKNVFCGLIVMRNWLGFSVQMLFKCDEEMKKKTGLGMRKKIDRQKIKINRNKRFFGTDKRSPRIICYYSCRSKKYKEDETIKEIIYKNNTEIC